MRTRLFVVSVTVISLIAICFIAIIISQSTYDNQTTTLSNAEEYFWIFEKELDIRHSVYYSGFKDSEYGVTVGYHGATYVTHDAGETWVKGDNEANCRYGLDLYGDQYLWTVGNYGGNRVSLNAGVSLMPVTDLPLVEERPNCFVQILNLDTVLVGSPLNLAITKDAGFTWKEIEIPEEITEIKGVFMLSISNIFLIDNNAVLFRTDDGGVIWEKISEIPVVEGIKNTDVPSVAIYFDNLEHGKIVYLDKNQLNYALETNDGGLTFTSTNLADVDRSAPYISEDGNTLTLVDNIGRLKLFSWSNEKH